MHMFCHRLRSTSLRWSHALPHPRSPLSRTSRSPTSLSPRSHPLLASVGPVRGELSYSSVTRRGRVHQLLTGSACFPSSPIQQRTYLSPSPSSTYKMSASTVSSTGTDGGDQQEDSAPAVIDVATNVKDVLGRIESARQACDRTDSVRLVAISKTKPASMIRQVYDEANHRHFGENYVKELEEKAPQLPDDILWHFVGHLQSNKCKKVTAVPNMYVVETVDSLRLAQALDKAYAAARDARRGRGETVGVADKLRFMLQVNSSGEDSKSGVKPDQCVAVVHEVLASCPNLDLVGLMTIGMYRSAVPETAEGEEEVEPDFTCLRNCRRDVALALNRDEHDLELSMGMSGDFERAISYGSTNVRVGSTIFGGRTYANKKS
eukprot:TRINITY_DN1282_c0_g2_i4.p1 TRINITY_DN1282_c0_g2~~TRINITY_DN1282_c0_g2_i4.p1  ORF type:complete len:377 (-),score=58.24 TRINITY_DN1282_c0_g2_i4:182-1312(-)